MVAVVPDVVTTGVLMRRTTFKPRVTEADLVGSCVLFAVRVTDVPESGAVKLPVEEMVPAVADQV